jgi:hypothetical protein
MTLGLFFIALLTVVSIAVFVKGFKEEEGEKIFGGIMMLIFVGLIIVGRDDSIDKNKRVELCITQGKEVIEVLGTKVCKL